MIKIDNTPVQDIKEPTLAQIDQWVETLKAEWLEISKDANITREVAIQMKLSFSELGDYHAQLLKTSNSPTAKIPRKAHYGYTRAFLAEEIIKMLVDDSEVIDCGF